MSFPLPVVPANGVQFSQLLTPNTLVTNRVTQLTILRIVGEVTVWLPVTTAPAATISARYYIGIKTADNSTPVLSLTQPLLDATDDWMIWRGGSLHASSVDGSMAIARHQIDIKSKRKMDMLSDQLYIAVNNDTPVGGSDIRWNFALRILMMEP